MIILYRYTYIGTAKMYFYFALILKGQFHKINIKVYTNLGVV